VACLLAMSIATHGADAPRPASAASGDAVALVRRLIGGEWIHESVTKKGKTFLSRYVITDGPDGVSIVMNGWRGVADNVDYHGNLHTWREPDGKTLRFHNINEKGSTSAGEVRALDDHTLEFDWFAQPVTDTSAKTHLQFIFEGDNVFRMVAITKKGDAWETTSDEKHERVDRAPEKFLKVKPPAKKK
jgi:hypothetical protein